MTDTSEPTPWYYRVFWYFIRRDACRLAAQTMPQSNEQPDDYSVRLWSATVFFESYLMHGAAGTRHFGPPETAILSIVPTQEAAE